MIAGVVFAEMRDGLEQPLDPKVAALIASAEDDIDSAHRAVNPAEALVDASLAQAKIALATFLRGGR